MSDGFNDDYDDFEYDGGGESTAGSKWCKEPGTYHFEVVAVDMRPSNKNGPIDDAAFRATWKVLSGTVEGQEGKYFDMLFFRPGPTNEGKDFWSRKKLDMFFLATNQATREQIEGKQKIRPRMQEIELMQIVARIERKKDRDGREDPDGYMTLAHTDIFHVDDPAVKMIPKCSKHLKHIPAKYRWLDGKPAQQQAVASESEFGEL